MVIPGSVAIIGGGVVAVEYATVFSQLGVGVSLLCKEENFLPFLESEIRSQLRARMAQQHVLFVSDDVEDISIDEERKTGKVFNYW